MSENENQPNATENKEEKKFALADVERAYFTPENFGAAAEVINKIETMQPKPLIRQNFKDKVADGFGILIMPISKRGEDGNETVGVAICQVPTLDTVSGVDGGLAFIQDAVINAYATKIGNAVRPRSDGTTSGSIPESIADFIESRRGRDSFKTYSELAPEFVKALKKMGLKTITAATLRQILQSRAAAETHYEKIPQAQWVNLLDVMVAKANEKGLDPAVLLNWKDTRDQTTVAEVEELDMEELNKIMANAA